MTQLVDNPDNFAKFPVFKSPLVVLKDIYNLRVKACKDVPSEVAQLMNMVELPSAGARGGSASDVSVRSLSDEIAFPDFSSASITRS